LLSDDSIKVDEVGGFCSKYGEKIHTDFWLGHLIERENLEDLDVDGNVILKCVLNKQNEMC